MEYWRNEFIPARPRLHHCNPRYFGAAAAVARET